MNGIVSITLTQKEVNEVIAYLGEQPAKFSVSLIEYFSSKLKATNDDETVDIDFPEKDVSELFAFFGEQQAKFSMTLITFFNAKVSAKRDAIAAEAAASEPVSDVVSVPEESVSEAVPV